ncbi:MAG: YwaF family protein [Clostridiales bacterium]|nr:YwaF family protein [Clostridiales bacterium]
MKSLRQIELGLKICTGLLLAVSLILSFTVSDYYIFNRISKYGFIFVFSQWIKKAGLLLLPLAVYYRKKCCADIAKYVLPIFVIISCFTFGDFFDATSITENSTPADLCFASINEFIPKPLNITLFFISNALYLVVCVGLFLRDGYKVNAKSFIYLPFAVIACMPLNLFENFFEINNFGRNHFLWFKNFTLWHALALIVLGGFAVAQYYFLRNKSARNKQDFLAAIAIVLLIQYHSKDSVLLGDGYNVYRYVFSAVPLFICNIGVYTASLSIFTRKRVLYAISFFVHAVGALSVFIYFGDDAMSNYGIIFSYSILFFCTTHCLLFALSVLPAALGQYRFRIKDCIIPLVYYFTVIVLATVASGLVSSFLEGYTYNGYALHFNNGNGDFNLPNYAFTQVNPLAFDLPVLALRIWKWDMNMVYVLLLYLFYVAMFWTYNGLYYAFLAIRKKVLVKPQAEISIEPQAEAAASTDDQQNE